MQPTPDPAATAETKQRVSPLTVLLIVLALSAAGMSAWFVFQEQVPPKPAPQSAAFPPMDQHSRDYLQNLRIENVALSRAENFIHQEVTILNATITNAGPQPVLAAQVTVEFDDEMRQVVLRETRSALGSPAVPLAPGESRTFEFSFDHVPSSWNRQQPSVTVSYLQLAPAK